MQADNAASIGAWDIWFDNLVTFGTAAVVLFAVFVFPVVLISFLFPGFAHKCRKVLSASIGSSLSDMAIILSKIWRGLTRILGWYGSLLQRKPLATAMTTLCAMAAVLLTIPAGSDEAVLYFVALPLVAFCIGWVLYLRRNGCHWRDIGKRSLKVAFWLAGVFLAVAVVAALLLWLDIPISARYRVRLPVGH